MENEQLWFGTLLSLGNQVQILTPDHIRERLLCAAKEIIELYG